MEITLENVQEFIQNNPEAHETLATQFLTPERVDTFLATEDGKKFIQPKFDSQVSKGINAWKQNNLQKLIDEAVIAANPADTPEQKRIKELEIRMQQADAERNHALQRSTALSLATERGLPTGLVEHFVGRDESETRAKINTYETEWKAALQVATEKVLAGAGSKATPQNPEAGSQGTNTRKLSEMSYHERAELYQSNPKEFQRLEALEN